MIYLGVKVQFEVVQFQFRLIQCHQMVLVVELVEVQAGTSFMTWWSGFNESMGASNLEMIYLVHGVKVQFEVVQFQLRLVRCHQVVLVVQLVAVKLVVVLTRLITVRVQQRSTSPRLSQPPPVSIPICLEFRSAPNRDQ
jgi:hypothetical protein